MLNTIHSMRSLNNEQCHIVMYNRAWCKSAISSLRYGSRVNGYKIFLSGPGGTGKSHVIQMIEHDMTNMFKHTINPGDDQPIVLITAPYRVCSFSSWWINNTCCFPSL